MPTYSYECKKCGDVFDVFHAMSASPRIKCESCGGATRRLLGSGAGLIFKGSGFYETDYKKSKNGGMKSGDSESGKNGESKASETKTENKRESAAKSSKKTSGPEKAA